MPRNKPFTVADLDHADLRDLYDQLESMRGTLFHRAIQAHFAQLSRFAAPGYTDPAPDRIAKTSESQLFYQSGATWGLQRGTLVVEELATAVQARLTATRKVDE